MNRYFEQVILSASPMELVRLAYDQAILAVKDARAHLSAGRIAERSKAIMKAYALVNELNAALDSGAAPELSARLRGLYLYIQGLLLKANCDQSEPPLAEAEVLLATLGEAWKQVPDAHPVVAAAMAA